MRDLKKNYLITQDTEGILFYLKYNSDALYSIFCNNINNNYTLFRKYLTHSDLVTRGKLTRSKKKKKRIKEYVKSCMLYYQSAGELLEYKKLPVAAQSNIMLPDEFYNTTKIDSPKKKAKKDYDIVSDRKLKIYIPWDTVKDFNLDDLNKICDKNGKNKYPDDEQAKLRKFDYNKYIDKNIQDRNLLALDALHVAAHGVGTHEDILFNHIRSFVFKGDVLNLLYDDTDKILYLFFERNERYYSLLNEEAVPDTSVFPIWNDYDEETRRNIVKTLYCASELNTFDDELAHNKEGEALLSEDEIKKLLTEYYKEYSLTVNDIVQSGKVPKSRWYQRKWREVLIKMDEIQYNVKGYAVCAITKTRGEHLKLGRFFVASHIKPYATCIIEKDYASAFDPNNGLILCANIDALFDKFLISIEQNGKIIVSAAAKSITGYGKFNFSKHPLDKYYLTPKRKKFLEYHKCEYDKRNK